MSFSRRCQSPAVDLSSTGSRLRWGADWIDVTIDNSDDLFSSFVLLRRAEQAADVIEFCRKWGVPLLCHHGLPMAHRQPDCRPHSDDDGPYVSVVQLAAFAQVVHDVAMLLTRLRPPKPRAGNRDNESEEVDPEWLRTSLFFDVSLLPDPDATLSEQAQQDVALMLTRLLEMTAVRPDVLWLAGNRRPHLDVKIGNIVAAASLALLASTGSGHLVTCQSCGGLYAPGRAPSEGHGRYCDWKPCQRVRWRENKDRQRRTKGDT